MLDFHSIYVSERGSRGSGHRNVRSWLLNIAVSTLESAAIFLEISKAVLNDVIKSTEGCVNSFTGIETWTKIDSSHDVVLT